MLCIARSLLVLCVCLVVAVVWVVMHDAGFAVLVVAIGCLLVVGCLWLFGVGVVVIVVSRVV